MVIEFSTSPAWKEIDRSQVGALANRGIVVVGGDQAQIVADTIDAIVGIVIDVVVVIERCIVYN